MDEIVECARRLASHGVYLFFKHEAHFLNPLVPAESDRLRRSGVVGDEEVRRVVLDLLPERLAKLARGIYSPVPIARALAAGESLEEVLDRFRYEMIRVDADQKWWWQERPVASRIQSFFTEHLAYEPAIELYFFEYKVNPDWWDKCYMECSITPIVAVQAIEAQTIEEHGLGEQALEEGGDLCVTLNNGRRDDLDLETLRLDARERLFCSSTRHGQVLFSDSLRFSILKGVSEDLERVEIGGKQYRLSWDQSSAPPPARPT